jgi:3-oxoacyl-[acyl-carrier-protein] synthase III
MFDKLPILIRSTGKALPARRVYSSELDRLLSRPAGFVQKSSGIEYRHQADLIESQSELAARALHDALNRAQLSPGSIDLLLSASGVQEQALPNTACQILNAACVPAGIPGFDINASCFSFPVALQIAASLLNTSPYRRIAIVSSDLASRGIDWDTPEASLIFGDGAAAAIVERGDGTTGIEGYLLRTYPEGRAYCEIRGGGSRKNPRTGMDILDTVFHMDGKRMFKLASKVMPGMLANLLETTGIALGDIDTVIPHQASHLGMRHLAEQLHIPDERIVDIYATHGNQVAASIPTALHEAFVTGRAAAGSRLLMIGTAAGLAVGGLILKL